MDQLAAEHFHYRLDTPGFDDRDARRITARWEPEPVRNSITGIYIDGAERLWVRTGRGEGASPLFEVYDLDGNHITTVETDFPDESCNWKFEFGEGRALAYDDNPSDFARVYILEISSNSEPVH